MKKDLIYKFTTKIIILILLFVCIGCGKKADLASEEDFSESSSDMTDIGMIRSDGNTSQSAMTSKELSTDDKISSMQITYRFGDETETLGGDTISTWLITKPDGSLSVNEDAAKDYVASLASKHDTFGRNRSFTTHDGKEITITGGDYGYWMDRVSTRQELIAQILTGESAELVPVYYGTAYSYGENDIGNTYVEINIGEQHLWVYKNGEKINESDFVSGGLFKGNGTPEGAYAITYKERDATLVGEGYQSSVSYWMPFNGNIGLHDAPWRDAFGGHIYYFKGSHGCINLPTKKAAEIYDQVEKGEAVIVYGSITKEEAISTLTMDEMVEAAQKGYIPLTIEIATSMYKQQGFDDETAAALAAAQLSGTVGEQQTDMPQSENENEQEQQPEDQEE